MEIWDQNQGILGRIFMNQNYDAHTYAQFAALFVCTWARPYLNFSAGLKQEFWWSSGEAGQMLLDFESHCGKIRKPVLYFQKCW